MIAKINNLNKVKFAFDRNEFEFYFDQRPAKRAVSMEHTSQMVRSALIESSDSYLEVQ